MIRNVLGRIVLWTAMATAMGAVPAGQAGAGPEIAKIVVRPPYEAGWAQGDCEVTVAGYCEGRDGKNREANPDTGALGFSWVVRSPAQGILPGTGYAWSVVGLRGQFVLNERTRGRGPLVIRAIVQVDDIELRRAEGYHELLGGDGSIEISLSVWSETEPAVSGRAEATIRAERSLSRDEESRAGAGEEMVMELSAAGAPGSVLPMGAFNVEMDLAASQSLDAYGLPDTGYILAEARLILREIRVAY